MKNQSIIEKNAMEFQLNTDKLPVGLQSNLPVAKTIKPEAPSVDLSPNKLMDR